MLDFFANHTLIEGDHNFTDIIVMEEIGRGNSHVHKIALKDKILALKQIQIKTDYEYQNFLKEISYMKELSSVSPYMIKYQGYFVTVQEINQYSTKKYAHILMQCADMNLQHLIAEKVAQRKHLRKKQILQIITFLLQAFVDLEKNKIAHCDIKPQNILVLNSETLEMKLCDVGSCKVISSQQMQEATIFGTVPFLAPQLVKMKSKKIISSNAFKSDVYSLGLLFLYLITFKKFTSKERIQITEQAYFQVISQWQKEARQLTDFDSRISQVLKNSLLFDEFRRPLFTGIKSIFQGEKKKKKNTLQNKIKKLELQSAQKKSFVEENQYISVPSNQINLFKRKLSTKVSNQTGIGFPISNKTMRTGFPSKLKSIQQRQASPAAFSPTSPLTKRKNTNISSSPQKSCTSLLDFKKIVYVTENQKQLIPYENFYGEQKSYVLFTNHVKFMKADCISIFTPCSLEVLHDLVDVQASKLFIEYANFQGIGVGQEIKSLSIKKIYANFSGCSLYGGYKFLFKAFCGENLQVLDITLSGSDVSFDEIISLLELLNGRSLKTFSLVLQNLHYNAEEHFQFTQKLSKIIVRKLIIVMNGKFIKYEKETRWLLPKNCQALYLEYQSNFLGTIISNLAISISKSPLKQLFLNFSNNNITKSEANIIFKTVASIEVLEKLVLNLSWNTIQDVSYMLTQFQKLKNITSLELKLFHCSISEEKIFQAIADLKYLFDRKLTIFKIGFDRTMRKEEFQELLQKNMEPFKNLRIDVVGKDNKYFYAFIKKKDKATKAKKNAVSNQIKGETTKVNFKSLTMNQKMPNFEIKSGFCQALVSNHESYETYLCLACCNLREISKIQYFCKFCIENCGHKNHNFVRIYQRKNCACAYSGTCSTDLTRQICAEQLNIKLKKQYQCLKCDKILCLGCANKCQQNHKNWIEESKQTIFFVCDSQKN